MISFIKWTKLSALLVASSLAASVPMSAKAGEQEGHGGESVDIDGRPALRDLVDNTVCEWAPMPAVLLKAGYFPRVLEGLTKTHWYLATSVQSAATSLSVCMSKGPLVKIPENIWNDVTVYKFKTKQAAIRLGDRVYLNMTIFDGMDEQNKAYLLFHEIMHSFIAEDIPQRATKLRSFVAVVRKNELKPMEPKEFGYQLASNDIAVPATTEALDPYRADLTLALDETADEDLRQIATTQLPLGMVLFFNDKLTVDVLRGKLRGRLSPLVQAQKPGDLGIPSLRVLLSKGLDPNVAMSGTPLLHWAIGVISHLRQHANIGDPKIAEKIRSYLELVMTLVTSPGIDINKLDHCGSDSASEPIVTNQCDGSTALYRAAESVRYNWSTPRPVRGGWGSLVESDDLVILLLQVPGIDVNRGTMQPYKNLVDGPMSRVKLPEDMTGATPLMRASQLGAPAAVAALLRAPGIQINAKLPSNGKTALELALENFDLADTAVDDEEWVHGGEYYSHTYEYIGDHLAAIKELLAMPGLDKSACRDREASGFPIPGCP